MGLKSLFSRQNQAPQAEPIDAAVCPHGTLIPHWDSSSDMGNFDRVSYFRCESCQEIFSREEAERQQKAGIQRMKQAG